jgi:hypothetical protein
MAIELKVRGRVGGYGRTGQFLKEAVFGKWYTSRQIMLWFHAHGDNIRRAQAKAVFESLDRGKCHRTQRKLIANRPAIMLLPPLIIASPAPYYLLGICKESICGYISMFILTSPLGTPLKAIKREYRQDSLELQEVAYKQKHDCPINVDGVDYSVAGWDLLDDIVRVLFKEFEPCT